MQNYEWRGRPIDFWASSRKHRIGKGHIMSVIATAEPEFRAATAFADARIRWAGHDDRGVPLEIIALDEPNRLVVIHAMPLAFRDRGRS